MAKSKQIKNVVTVLRATRELTLTLEPVTGNITYFYEFIKNVQKIQAAVNTKLLKTKVSGLLVVLLFSYNSFSQGKIVALRIMEPAYYTANLNINGVAIKSMILVADSTTLTNAIVGKESVLLNNWLIKDCGVKYLLAAKDVVKSLRSRSGIDYTPKFQVKPGTIYFIIESSKDFIAVYQSMAMDAIPPPVVPKGAIHPGVYKHIELCELDACIALCVKKTEASFEVCCNGYCFTISYDGELNLSASSQLPKK